MNLDVGHSSIWLDIIMGLLLEYQACLSYVRVVCYDQELTLPSDFFATSVILTLIILPCGDIDQDQSDSYNHVRFFWRP